MAVRSACRVNRACPVPGPASAQPQRMGQLVESGRRPSDNPDLLRSDVGALSHGLPGKVSGERIVDAALHDAAALAPSVRNKRPAIGFFPRRYPLMREQTAHDEFPLDGLKSSVGASSVVTGPWRWPVIRHPRFMTARPKTRDAQCNLDPLQPESADVPVAETFGGVHESRTKE